MKKLDLNGKWSFHEVGRGKWFDAQVPNCNYKDLINLNEIIHPFKDQNIDKVQWVAERNWEYVKEFNLTTDFLVSPSLVLVCEGLTTLADIYINDKLIAKVDNAHRIYEFNIKNFVSRLTNKLRIKFRSPIQFIESSQDKQAMYTPKAYADGSTYLRTPLYLFGSTQNPPLPISGITGNIYILSYDETRFGDITLTQSHFPDYITINSKISIKSQLSIEEKEKEIYTKITIVEPNGTKYSNNVLIVDKETEALNVINDPKLWNTHDLNEDDTQPLYTVKYELFLNGTLVDVITKVIGLRSLTINRDKDDYGKNFAFILNGQPIYIKGGVLYPSELLKGESTLNPVTLADRLVNANINLVRIPADSTYISEDYLAEFDKKGILVWQDLPFIGGEYPLDKKDFVKNITLEITEAITRMATHPSLALVCGNYGIEIGYTRVKFNRETRHAYTEFFYTTLPEILDKINSQLLYIPSAPLSSEPFSKTNSPRDGVSHLWNIWSGMEAIAKYNTIVPRFCTEFGLASLCNIDTLQKFSSTPDIEINSEYIDSRAISKTTFDKIIYYMSNSFRVPKDIEYFCYVSGLVQSDYYKKMILFQRSNKRKNNGIIFSNINSIYPGANMSCIDYNGTYKPTMYAITNAFAPIALYVEYSKGKVKATVINDYNCEFRGRIHWFIESYDGNNLDAGEQNFSTNSFSTLRLPHIEVKDSIKQDVSNKLFVMEIFDEDNTLVVREIQPLARNNKHSKLKQPNLTYSVHMVRNYAFITVSSDTFARYVNISIAGNDNPFSDNYFDILAGEEITVSVLTGKVTAEEISSKIKLTSLYETEQRTSSIFSLYKNITTVVSTKTLINYIKYQFIK